MAPSLFNSEEEESYGFDTSEPENTHGFSKVTISVIGATALIVINMLVMLALAPTVASDIVIWMYESAPLSPWLGLIVISGLLTAGRLASYTALGYDAVEPEDTIITRDVNISLVAVGLVVTQIAYGIFGGAALSLVEASTRITVLKISAGITAVFVVIAGGAELWTDRSLAPVGKSIYGFGFLGGVAFLFLGWVVSLVDPTAAGYIYLGAFGLIVIGWLGDMLHEISVLTEDDRSAAINAFGLYSAITGVLVHIIWLVVQAMAEE